MGPRARRPARVARGSSRPQAKTGRIATQLHPGPTPFEFTAPNLQYLMDSPSNSARSRSASSRSTAIRSGSRIHHAGTLAELDGFVSDVEKIVREQREIFGEFPEYEPGHYTFLADYLPYAIDDGMEHRNSTVMTSPSTLRTGRRWLLDTRRA